MITLKTPLEKIPRIGIKYAKVLEKLNMRTVEDFLLHFPFRYEDYSERVYVSDLAAGQTATVMGEITQSKLIRTWKRKMLITECYLSDETGSVRAVWFNQPYVSDSLVKGKGARLSGKVSLDNKGLFFSNPAWELSSRTPTNTGRIVPIYPETEGITSRWIRWHLQNLIKYADEFIDPLPEHIVKALKLPSLSKAIKLIHFPENVADFELAQRRFAFQQMYLMQLASQCAKNLWEKQTAVNIPFEETLIKNFVTSLPFTLTNAQRKSAFQIFKDMEKSMPMNRLLNGDVGSGKTIVAALSSLAAVDAGFQVALLAPTEVLARQHFESICKVFKEHKINIALLTNAYKLTNQVKQTKITSNKEDFQKFKREDLLAHIKNGGAQIVIGTHAIIQKDVLFSKLALIIIDEQHRFGVSQRAYLQQKIADINDGLPNKIPHLLSMTATPIPRTLSLTFFGNLNLSVLDEMPKNRKPIITKVVGARERQKTYEFIKSEIASGHQAFVIFPLVEESEKLSELKAATQEHERLSREIFPELSLGLLHGKLKSAEKEQVMADFKSRKYDILIATSVVEVGIDVPNATVIIIEDADRFGLSQLHQFRGRVGRSEHQSYCFLFTSSKTTKAQSRLEVMEKSSNGFVIAEEDLKLRGPGEFLGTRQSGLPDIAMEHITNVKLIEIAHDYAEQTLAESPTLKDYPLLQKELAKFQTDVHLE